MSISPRLIAVFCLLFVGLGTYNLAVGRRRIIQARQLSRNSVWYKQTNILVGIEFFLLALAFFMNLALSSQWVPTSMYGIVIPFYLVVLIASGTLAGVVIFRNMSKNRRQRVSTQPTTSNASVAYQEEQSGEDQADQADQADHTYLAQKRRERRQKAAQARRRRAGKA